MSELIKLVIDANNLENSYYKADGNYLLLTAELVAVLHDIASCISEMEKGKVSVEDIITTVSDLALENIKKK